MFFEKILQYKEKAVLLHSVYFSYFLYQLMIKQ